MDACTSLEMRPPCLLMAIAFCKKHTLQGMLGNRNTCVIGRCIVIMSSWLQKLHALSTEASNCCLFEHTVDHSHNNIMQDNRWWWRPCELGRLISA